MSAALGFTPPVPAPLAAAGARTDGLTASFDAACISWRHAQTASSLLRAAGGLLWLAKLKGREQVQQRTLG